MNRMSMPTPRPHSPRIRIGDAAMQLLQTQMPEPGNTAERIAMCHDTVLLNEALSTAHNAPDIRQDRIAAIRARLEAGEYEIDCKSIAMGIIGENPELFK